MTDAEHDRLELAHCRVDLRAAMAAWMKRGSDANIDRLHAAQRRFDEVRAAKERAAQARKRPVSRSAMPEAMPDMRATTEFKDLVDALRPESDDTVFFRCRDYATARCNARFAFAEAERYGQTDAGREFKERGIKWSREARVIYQTATGDLHQYLENVKRALETDPAMTKFQALRWAGLTKPMQTKEIENV